ncbi:MAG: LPXTG cell wall anchor domain-containing protein [Acidimicrobiales bacterium]
MADELESLSGGKPKRKAMTRKLQSLITLGALTLGFALASPASAEDCALSTPEAGTTSCSTTVDPTPLPGSNPTSGGDVDAVEVTKPGKTVEAAKAELPVTGSETLAIAGMGAALVLAGGFLVSRSRQAKASV